MNDQYSPGGHDLARELKSTLPMDFQLMPRDAKAKI
jgi:hypothetical protein